MSPLEKGVLWMVGILAFVFALCIGLSWYSFEYIDWKTVSTMGLMLLPVIGAASVVVLWSERRVKAPATQKDVRAARPASADEGRVPPTAKPAGGGI